MGYYRDKIMRRLALAALGYPPKNANVSGFDLGWDIQGLLPRYEVRLVFDVGANVGQSAEKYLRDYPAAVVHSFEPAEANYWALCAQFAGEGRVICHRLAIGSGEGMAYIAAADAPDRLRVVAEEGLAADRPEVVRVTTLDRICADLKIDHISLLKVDTEGMDLDVLKGAVGLLDGGAIGLIQVEAGMNSTNGFHIPLREFMEFLEPRGYHLFRIYDQVSERTVPGRSSGGQILRRANPVFISCKIDICKY